MCPATPLTAPMKPGPKFPSDSALLLAFGAHPDDIEFGCGGAELADQLRGASLSHCGVEIDYVDQRVGAKPVEQAEDIVDG